MGKRRDMRKRNRRMALAAQQGWVSQGDKAVHQAATATNGGTTTASIIGADGRKRVHVGDQEVVIATNPQEMMEDMVMRGNVYVEMNDGDGNTGIGNIPANEEMRQAIIDNSLAQKDPIPDEDERDLMEEDPDLDDDDAAFEAALKGASTEASSKAGVFSEFEGLVKEDDDPAIRRAEHSMQEDADADDAAILAAVEKGRGQCPVCSTSQKVRKDGSMGKHVSKAPGQNEDGACKGTGQTVSH